jgi:hypothetical protein
VQRMPGTRRQTSTPGRRRLADSRRSDSLNAAANRSNASVTNSRRSGSGQALPRASAAAWTKPAGRFPRSFGVRMGGGARAVNQRPPMRGYQSVASSNAVAATPTDRTGSCAVWQGGRTWRCVPRCDLADHRPEPVVAETRPRRAGAKGRKWPPECSTNAPFGRYTQPERPQNFER